jgi:hypothetical protein
MKSWGFTFNDSNIASLSLPSILAPSLWEDFPAKMSLLSFDPRTKKASLLMRDFQKLKMGGKIE